MDGRRLLFITPGGSGTWHLKWHIDNCNSNTGPEDQSRASGRPRRLKLRCRLVCSDVLKGRSVPRSLSCSLNNIATTLEDLGKKSSGSACIFGDKGYCVAMESSFAKIELATQVVTPSSASKSRTGCSRQRCRCSKRLCGRSGPYLALPREYKVSFQDERVNTSAGSRTV